MINIKLGYVRGVENSRSYKTQMDFLSSSNVERVFHENDAGNIKLMELIDYARSGDIIFVYSIASLGKNVKSIINLTSANIKPDEVEFIGACWRRHSVFWKGYGYYLVYTDSIKTEIRDIAGMAEEANAIYDKLVG